MKRQLTIQEWKNSGKELSAYQQAEVDKAIELAAKVSEFFPATVYIAISEQDGQIYYEYPQVMLDHLLEIVVRYDWSRKKQYEFYTHAFVNKYKNVSVYEQSQISKTLQEPKGVGVLTARKIQEWVDYYQDFNKLMAEANTKNAAVIEAFMQSIKDLSVTWSRDGKSGEILRNGISYLFTILESSISEKIEVHYSVHDSLTNFLKLSDNKYEN